MSREKKNPYLECPIYETEHFIVRRVEERDAEDLLQCYSDPRSAMFFNSDNCTSNFVYKSVEEMQKCIRFWIAEYKMQYYVRFSIVEKRSRKAIGTIEIFSRKEEFGEYGVIGVLRVDLVSSFETEEFINEILTMVDENLFDDFEVDSIITKAIPEATARVVALERNGYRSIEGKVIVSYDHYFIKFRNR